MVLMEWWKIVFGIGLLSFCIGLSIGLWMPRETIGDIFFNYFMLLSIFIFSLFGIFLTASGLRK